MDSRNLISDAETIQFAAEAATLASDLRVEDVAVLDLRGLSGLWDFFILGTGTSERQMHAVLARIERHAKQVGRAPFKIADTRQASWILADYSDVAIHLFDAQHRSYYDLDGLWDDAPRLDWRSVSVRALEEPSDRDG